jgi:hypothetical protein
MRAFNAARASPLVASFFGMELILSSKASPLRRM